MKTQNEITLANAIYNAYYRHRPSLYALVPWEDLGDVAKTPWLNATTGLEKAIGPKLEKTPGQIVYESIFEEVRPKFTCVQWNELDHDTKALWEVAASRHKMNPYTESEVK